jgi:hypothetical protein
MMTGAELGPDRRLPQTLNRKSAMRETQVTGLLVQNITVRNLSNPPRRALRLAVVALGIGLVMTVGAARAGSDDEEDNRSFSQKIVDGFKAGFTTTNMDSKGIDYRTIAAGGAATARAAAAGGRRQPGECPELAEGSG